MFCNLYKCLPFISSAHAISILNSYILFPSDLDNGICTSTSTHITASLAKLSALPLPRIATWARVYIITISLLFHTIYDEQKEAHTEFADGYLYFLFQCIIMPTMIHYILLLLIFDCLPPILMPTMCHITTADAAPFLLCFDGGRQQTTHFQVHYCHPLDWSMEQNLQHHQHHLLLFLIKR